MVYITKFGNFLFIEGGDGLAVGRTAYPVSADLSFKIGAQLKSLTDVKQELKQKAEEYGCNAIIGFTYGQKSRWLAIDDVAFFGKGKAIQLSPEEWSVLWEKAKN